MSARDPIPPVFQKLISAVRDHASDVGGEGRGALAEIRVRSIMATERSSDVYEKAGKDLKAATVGLKWMTAALAVATLILALVTAFVK